MKLTDITPDAYRCVKETCPAIYTIFGGSHSSCPTVIADPEKPESYVIIGKIIGLEGDHPELSGKVGRDEMAVEIPAVIVNEAVNAELAGQNEIVADQLAQAMTRIAAMDGPHSGYGRVIQAFDSDEVTNSFLSEDGDGGFAGGVYRMTDEIKRLREAETQQAKRIAELEAALRPFAIIVGDGLIKGSWKISDFDRAHAALSPEKATNG